MLLAARNGMAGVNATYRLVPQPPWPADGEDVAAALRWVRSASVPTAAIRPAS